MSTRLSTGPLNVEGIMPGTVLVNQKDTEDLLYAFIYLFTFISGFL